MDTYRLTISKNAEVYLQSQFLCDDEAQAATQAREIVGHFAAEDGFTHDLTMRREQWFAVDIT